MKNLLSRVGAMALALFLPCAALAQAPLGRSIQAPSGYLPASAIYCDDGTGHAALCNFGGGGSGSGTATITSRISYTATAGGTGYSAGDQLDRIVTSSPGSPTVNAYWVNVSAGGLVTGTPAAGSITLKPETLTNTVFGATQSGAWNVGVLGSVAVTGTFWQPIQPISASSLPLPSGAATDAKLEAVRALLAAALTVNLPAGAATDAKLETIRALLAAALTINLPSGASTAAKQDALLTALGSPLQGGGTVMVGNNADPATGTKQTANTNAIAATQAATGTLAATGQTVTIALPQITPTSRSGLFGTTSTQLMPANATRHFIQVQVQASSSICYINGTAAATADQNSLMISGSSGMFESTSHVGTGAISIICSAASTPVYAREG